MKNYPRGIVLIIIASAMIIFRKYLAEKAMDSQNQTFGFHFGRREVNQSAFIIFVIGIMVLVIGILTMLGRVQWK